VVQDNFAFYAGRYPFEKADEYFAAETESKAVRILDELGVRYIVTDARGAAHGTRYAKRAMVRRLYPYPAREVKPGLERMLPLRFSALRHHRLILESQPGRMQVPNLRVFERVAGAQIVGEATPNTLVRAALEVTSRSRAKPGAYRTSIRSSSDGRYVLHVPYATSATGAVVTADHYQIACGDWDEPSDTDAVAVTEEAVVGGEQVAGPTLSGGG